MIFDFPLSFLEIMTIMIINDAAFCAECLDAVFDVLPPSVHPSTPSLSSALPLSQADKLAAAPRPYRAFRHPLDAAEQVSPKLDSIPSLPSTGHATAVQESAQESLTRCPLLAARTRASRTARHAWSTRTTVTPARAARALLPERCARRAHHLRLIRGYQVPPPPPTAYA